MSAFAGSVPYSAGAVVLLLAATFIGFLIVGKHSLIDSTWGLLFAAVAIAAFACSSGHGDPVRRWLLLALPVIWGLRLAIHTGRRSIGKPEDPRYGKLVSKATGHQNLYALRTIYLLQGLLAFLISTPIQVGAFERGPVGPIGWVGAGVWCLGVFFETVGDHQMEAFRRNPANKGGIIETGLWRYTRHPNYFGDACVWWGIFAIAADHWPGVITIYAPILMTLLLTKGSGVRVLEGHLRDRPGWASYAARTSTFVPLPPRRGRPRDG